jgi:riboflavin kinase / FMN adenylyltransferase
MIYEAEVISGKGRGKGLGFPTLNLRVPENFSQSHGIYSGWVLIDKQKFLGAFHFGPVPAFNESEVSLEVFLIDADLTQTPKRIKFEIVEYIREIRNFKNEGELSEQIGKDIEEIKKQQQSIY